MTPVVGYAGLTHLGLVSGAAAAAKGFATVCFDPDAGRVAALAAGRLPVFEPGLDELLAEHRGRLEFTAEATALAKCDLIYVATDVPTDDAGASDLAPITALLETVCAAASPTAVVVILSQVPVGFTKRHAHPGRPLFYQVETLVFGRAVERALQPERFILGLPDPALPVPPALAAFLRGFGCPLLPMRLESAELAKMSINLCLMATVAIANTLADLSERVGAAWDEIAPALRLDARIGPHAYLQPGLGFAGGNLERDAASVLGLAAAAGSDTAVVHGIMANSRRQRGWVLRALHQHVLGREQDPVIAVLGLAYKVDTASTKNSPAVALIRSLPEAALRLYDPVVPAAGIGHARAFAAASAAAAVEGAAAVVIMTPWPEFRSLDAAALAARMAGRVVIDPFGVLDADACRRAGLAHLRLGRGAFAPHPQTPSGAANA